MGSNFGIVGFAASNVVNRLHGNACRLEKFGGKGMRSGDVGSKAMTLVEPVSLPKFSDDETSLIFFTQDEFAYVFDLRSEYLSGVPIGFDEGFDLKGEGLGTGKLTKIKFLSGDFTRVDNFCVSTRFSLGKCFKKAFPAFGGNLADVLNDAKGARNAFFKFFGKSCFRREEIRVVNLELPNFIEVSWCNAATR